jgi:hypothetical protein
MGVRSYSYCCIVLAYLFMLLCVLSRCSFGCVLSFSALGSCECLNNMCLKELDLETVVTICEFF